MAIGRRLTPATFDWHLKTQEKLDWLTGTAQWVFKDFASPLRSDNGIPRVNQKGVVERDLTKKESFFVFQSYWSKKPMVHIYGENLRAALEDNFAWRLPAPVADWFRDQVGALIDQAVSTTIT